MIDVSTLPELVTQEAYPVMVQSYETTPSYYTGLCNVRSVSETNLYGLKGSVLETAGQFRERADGAEAESDAPGKAYTWQVKIRQFTRRLDIPQRMLQSLGSAGKVTDYVQQQISAWGEQAMRRKDLFLAGMLQDGTLTAGSLEFFDNSFPDNDDPNAGFIYDGLPFFDTAHTLSGASGTYANHTASAALTSTNLQTVLTTIRSTNAVNDRGDRILLMPDTLVVPQALLFTARQVLNSQLLPGGTNNDVNPLAGELQIVANPYLTADTDSWYVCEAGKGIDFWDSGAPVIETQYDAKRKVLSVVAEMHFGSAVTDWRRWYNANKAAS